MTPSQKEHFVTRMQTIYGENFDPLQKMAENAMRLQNLADNSTDDANAQIDANKEWERITQFTTPKLKSIEHKGDGFVTEVHVHR
ncbi:hypothetical protein OAA60_00635 [Porticoccaceae bacterium]|nr:hypothetical protein [Porticoccaceae bacterium]